MWEEVKAQNPGASLEELSKLEADYRQTLQSAQELDAADPDHLAEMTGAWSNGFGLDMEGLDPDFGLNNIDQRTRYDEHGIPMLDQYDFGMLDVDLILHLLLMPNFCFVDLNNSFLARPAEGLLDDAKRLLAMNGSLDEAALLCEAAIQKGILGEGGYEAWILLGQARSMDEREVQALRALKEGTRIAQQNGNFEVGMLVCVHEFALQPPNVM